MEYAPFGRTGHHSSRVVFGAAALGAMNPERAATTLATARRRGINHIDTAASYGAAEDRLAPFLADHRHEVFLATKTGERTGTAARRELERSLARMGVDQIDLIQLHNLVEPDEWDMAHAPGGAVEALVAARDEGLVRFIGVTGHGTRIAAMHLRSLERFDFDTVLLPCNPLLLARPDYGPDFRRLVDECARREVAVQTIKAVARRRWPADSSEPHFAWYEPLPPGPALQRAVAFVLSQPGLFLNSSSDARLLEPICDAAEAVSGPPSAEQLTADADEFAMAALFDGAALERI